MKRDSVGDRGRDEDSPEVRRPPIENDHETELDEQATITPKSDRASRSSQTDAQQSESTFPESLEATRTFQQPARRLPENGDPFATEIRDAAQPVPSHVLLPGTEFGKYRIEKTLGQGAMGAVYLATDQELGRAVALKIPKVRGRDVEHINRRFLREAKAAATIQHPNICPVYEWGEQGGRYYMVMAYVDGSPLSRYLTRGKPVAERQAALLVRKLAIALDEAHRAGIVHRDLKPANIMIDRRKEPIVMDFGLARRDNHDDPRLTHAGAFVGTPAYTSPEQIRNVVGTVGPKSDIYTLGVILYELLTGQLPFSGDGTISILGQILVDTPPEPRERNPEISAAVNRICLRAMAKNSEERYESMGEFAQELTLLLKGKLKDDREDGASSPLDDLSSPDLPEWLDQVATPVVETSPSSERLTAAPIDFLQSSVPAAADEAEGATVPQRKGLRALAIMGVTGAVIACVAGLFALAYVASEPETGMLRLQLLRAPTTATVSLDGELIGQAEIAAGVSLTPGQHSLVVEAPGYVEQRQAVEILPGQTTGLSLTLVRAVVPRDPAPRQTTSSTSNISGFASPAPRLQSTARASLSLPKDSSTQNRPAAVEPASGEVVFADFEQEGFGQWIVQGEAFGEGPFEIGTPGLTPFLASFRNQLGNRIVHSNPWWHDNRVAPGKDRKFGSLTSPPFVLTHRFINFDIFGGRHPGKAEFQLLVQGQVVLASTGNHAHYPITASWDVAEHVGTEVQLRIIDNVEGYLEFIAVDNIRFSDTDGRQQSLDKIQQRLEVESVEWRGHRYWFPDWQVSMHDSDESLFETALLVSGGRLLVISDEEEFRFVMDHVRGPTWLGLRGDGSGGWVTTSGQPIAYQRWRDGKPMNSFTRRAFMDEVGDWYDLFINAKISPTDGCAFVAFEWGEESGASQPIRGADIHRQLAQQIIGSAEWIDLRTPSKYIRVNSQASLPKEDFELLGIRLRQAAELPPSLLADFRKIDTITHLELPETRDASLSLANHCPRLRQLKVSGGRFDGRSLLPLPAESELRFFETWTTNLSPAFYEKFSETQQLRVLSIAGGPFHREMLSSFRRNEHLGTLLLNATGDIGQPGVRLASQFRHVRDAMFWGCGLTDGSLAMISEMKELRDLQLGRNPGIRGAGLKHLGKLEELEVLSVFECNVNDVAMDMLPPFDQLRRLCIGATSVTRIPASFGQRLPVLTHLEIHSTRVNDQSVAALLNFPMLHSLKAENSKLSDTAIRTLSSRWGISEVSR